MSKGMQLEPRTPAMQRSLRVGKPRPWAGLLVLVTTMFAIPPVAFAQPPDKPLPTFTQTADAPQPAPAAASPATPPSADAVPSAPAINQPAPAAAPGAPNVPGPAPAVAAPPPYPAQPPFYPGYPVPYPAPPAPSSPAATDQPPKPSKYAWEWVRSGFYLRMLTNVGYARATGDGPAGSARISGLGAGSTLAIGGGLGYGLVVAGTLQSTQVTAKFNGGPYAGASFTSGAEIVPVSDKASVGSSQIGALVDWYPLKAEGLHVAISGGLGSVVLTNQADDSTFYGSNVAGTFLVGYDWPIAPTWALGVALLASGSSSANLKKQGSDEETGYKLRSFFIGLSGSLLLF